MTDSNPADPPGKEAIALTREADRHFAAGRFDAALSNYVQAVKRDPNFGFAWFGLSRILEMSRTTEFHAELYKVYAAAFASPFVSLPAISRGAACQILHRHGVASDQATVTPDKTAAIAEDALLRRLLHTTINYDFRLEKVLIQARRLLAHKYLAGQEFSASERALAMALAAQAHSNEHIWFLSPGDGDSAARLNAAVDRLANKDDGTGNLETAVALYAAFRPLPTLAAGERLIQAGLAQRTKSFRALIEQALLEPSEERTIAAGLPALKPIADATSARVRAQYEENPYPRWLRLPPVIQMDLYAALSQRYPHAAPLPNLGGRLEILMPGCGTGQHPLTVARAYAKAQVFALDLSRASLAYGVRMARKLKIENIEFVQGDILDLPALKRQFDHIECVGVLHHMREPELGFRRLVERLRPGACLRVGLYGEYGRSAIAKLRKMIAAGNLPSNPEVVRAFRHEMLSSPELGPLLSDILQWDDFYATSPLRDLLFHVEEHRFTMPRVRRMIESEPVRFLGFEFAAGVGAARRVEAKLASDYQARFPDDPTLSRLDLWEQFEAEQPDRFPGYAFWCQKKTSSG
jgi:SAM-dependent methyltransferase